MTKTSLYSTMLYLNFKGRNGNKALNYSLLIKITSDLSCVPRVKSSNSTEQILKSKAYYYTWNTAEHFSHTYLKNKKPLIEGPAVAVGLPKLLSLSSSLLHIQPLEKIHHVQNFLIFLSNPNPNPNFLAIPYIIPSLL